MLDQFADTGRKLSRPRRHTGDLDLLNQLGQRGQFVDEADCPGHRVDDRRNLCFVDGE